MRRIFTELALILLLICSSIYIGFLIGQETLEPQVITHTIIETQTETKYIELIDECRVPAEVPVRIWYETVKDKELRHFESSRELQRWLDKYPIEVICSEDYDCEDFAFNLQQKAFNDGYWLSIQYDTRKYHALNNAWVGLNSVYFIEPQTHEFWFVGRRD